MPWNNIINCHRVVSYPSQVISVFAEAKVAHLTIDSGATVSFITLDETKRLSYKLKLLHSWLGRLMVIL